MVPPTGQAGNCYFTTPHVRRRRSPDSVHSASDVTVKRRQINSRLLVADWFAHQGTFGCQPLNSFVVIDWFTLKATSKSWPIINEPC